MASTEQTSRGSTRSIRTQVGHWGHHTTPFLSSPDIDQRHFCWLPRAGMKIPGHYDSHFDAFASSFRCVPESQCLACASAFISVLLALSSR